MTSSPPIRRMRAQILVFALLAILSTSAKVYLAGLGHNFDVESWAMFADMALDGKNVYAETYRNPYGPIWIYVCAGLSFVQTHVLGGNTLEGFHRLVALFLSVCDIAIAALLARYFSFIAGALFLANPVSILISGFHSQVDTIAVLLALAACVVLDKAGELRPVRFLVAMSLLGMSLVVKHVLFFFPLWLVLHPGFTRRRRVLSLLPYGIFAASFIPFIREERGLEGVIEYVLMYDSVNLDGFFPRLVHVFVPLQLIEELFDWVPVFSGFKLVWLAGMLFTGLAVRGKAFREQLLVYLVAVLALSSAIADQYLVIPLAACFVYWRRLTSLWYVALSTIYLASSQVNIGMLPRMASYAERVRELGLERWHPVGALFVFLILYLARGAGANRSKSSPIDTRSITAGKTSQAETSALEVVSG